MSDTDPSADASAASDVQDTETPEQTPEPASSDGPWAADLASKFDDPAVRAQVDGFLRETIQPYVTQLEQQTQPNRDALRLWSDFGEDPNGTFTAVARELYGEEQASDILNVLTGTSDDTEDDVNETLDDANDPIITADELPDDVREAVEYIQQERREREFSSALNELKEDNPDVEIIDDLFYPFITAADGDLDEAVASYKEWNAQAQERLGIQVPDPDEIEKDTPPPTVTPDRTPSSPPVESEPASLDDAIEEWFAEKNAPPSV